MAGMVIAHYVWADRSGTTLDTVAELVRGRAMPLFVLLGGVGVSFLTSRSTMADRALLIRAAILFPLGVALQEATTFIAIILQFYALFFVAAVGLRRLSTRWLVALAAIITVAGGWTAQVIAPELDRWTEIGDLVDNPEVVVWSLLFNGHYPFFPVAAFFVLGMVLGRLDLRSEQVALALTAIGGLVGFATIGVSRSLVDGFSVDTAIFDEPREQFLLARLLDTTGHSEMTAWVISAAGTSTAILGLSLLIAPRLGSPLRPVVALGQLALTFYVFQAVLVRWTPHPTTTPLAQEFLTATAIYFGFMVFAFAWRSWLSVGPLEALLRLGSRSRKTSAVVREEARLDRVAG